MAKRVKSVDADTYFDESGSLVRAEIDIERCAEVAANAARAMCEFGGMAAMSVRRVPVKGEEQDTLEFILHFNTSSPSEAPPVIDRAAPAPEDPDADDELDEDDDEDEPEA